MKKAFRFSFCMYIILIGFKSYSQDVITLKNGDEIQSKVLEISNEIIKYKKWNNQEGPIYSSNIADVLVIKYQNGTKDVFNTTPSQTSPAQNDQTNKEIPAKKVDTSIDTSKRDIKQNVTKRMDYENGKFYVGEWIEDKKNGKGRMTYKDGSYYEGEWKDDKMEGDGIIVSGSDGSKYVGNFLNDERDGKGVVYNKKGIIEAEYTYVNGVLDGHYMTNSNNGSHRIEGEMKNGELEGQGTLYYKNPDTHVISTFNGEYQKGKMYNGIYIITYPEGLKYSIEYKNGKKGKAKEITASSVSQNAPTATQNSKPPGCEDVDFIGAFKISGHGIIPDIHVATIRNRATYTKAVQIEWIDEYGRAQKAAFDVKAGEKIDGRLGVSVPGVQPRNVRMTSCD